MFSTDPTPSRRAVLTGTCGAACVTVLAACSAGGSDTPSAPAAPAGGLASTSEIPVGGGTVFGDQDVVVTQPQAGNFRGFSATCTHRGCTVSEVRDGTINCPCHGSKFAIGDGAVVNGPAESPLPPRQIQVNGEEIVLV